jgi:hypothetical protein
MASEAPPAAAPAEQQKLGPGTTAPLRPTSSSPGAFVGASMAGRRHARYLNALVYGRHGGGKSTLAGSAVDVDEMQDVLVITAEGGDIVFESNPRITQWEKIDVIKVDRIEQANKVYEWLKAHVQLRDRPGAEDQLRKLQDAAFPPDVIADPERLRRFRTVVVDSLTEIEGLNLTKILDLDSLGIDAGDEMAVAGYGEFRKNMHIMQKLVRNFRDMDIHFLAICAESYSQDERKAFHYGPRLTGQLKDILQGFFDVVGWLVPSTTVDQGTGVSPRRLFVQPQTAPKADAKCRLATYKGSSFDNPTMTDIMVGTGFIKRK